MTTLAARRNLFKQIRNAPVPVLHPVPTIRIAALPSVKVIDAEISIAMLRALCDMSIGPAYEQPDGYYLGATPNRLLIRRQTMEGLRLRGLVEFALLPNRLHVAHRTEAGKVKCVNHPLKFELPLAR